MDEATRQLMRLRARKDLQRTDAELRDVHNRIDEHRRQAGQHQQQINQLLQLSAELDQERKERAVINDQLNPGGSEPPAEPAPDQAPENEPCPT